MKKQVRKHPRFACLGDEYPIHLETQYDRILTKIEVLWDAPEISDYFSGLVIDMRGGRQGFPKEVMEDIVRLRDFRELESLRKTEEKEDAIYEIEQRGLVLKPSNFFHAVESGDQALVDLFVRAQFNIHIEDENGNPPLIIALKKGYTVICKILLNAGAEVNVRSKDGLTPLLIACGKATKGYKSIAETLINKGAVINVRDRLGYTPLLLSLSGGTVDIAELLIDKGADISVTTRTGETPLALARKHDNARIVAILELMGAAE